MVCVRLQHTGNDGAPAVCCAERRSSESGRDSRWRRAEEGAAGLSHAGRPSLADSPSFPCRLQVLLLLLLLTVSPFTHPYLSCFPAFAVLGARTHACTTVAHRAAASPRLERAHRHRRCASKSSKSSA